MAFVGSIASPQSAARRRIAVALAASLLLHVVVVASLPGASPMRPRSLARSMDVFLDPTLPAQTRIATASTRLRKAAARPIAPRKIETHAPAKMAVIKGKLMEPPTGQSRAPKPSAPASPPQTSSPEAEDAAKASYAQILAAAIAHHRSYPVFARMQHMQGNVELSLNVVAGGRVIGAKVSRSSGFDLLDQQALEMVKQAEPLPAPPRLLEDKAFSIVVPVVFRLEG